MTRRQGILCRKGIFLLGKCTFRKVPEHLPALDKRGCSPGKEGERGARSKREEPGQTEMLNAPEQNRSLWNTALTRWWV